VVGDHCDCDYGKKYFGRGSDAECDYCNDGDYYAGSWAKKDDDKKCEDDKDTVVTCECTTGSNAVKPDADKEETVTPPAAAEIPK